MASRQTIKCERCHVGEFVVSDHDMCAKVVCSHCAAAWVLFFTRCHNYRKGMLRTTFVRDLFEMEPCPTCGMLVARGTQQHKECRP